MCEIYEEIKDIDRILWDEQPPDDEWYFAINPIQNSLEFEICDYENKVAQLALEEQEVKKVYNLIERWLKRKR